MKNLEAQERVSPLGMARTQRQAIVKKVIKQLKDVKLPVAAFNSSI